MVPHDLLILRMVSDIMCSASLCCGFICLGLFHYLPQLSIDEVTLYNMTYQWSTISEGKTMCALSALTQ